MRRIFTILALVCLSLALQAQDKPAPPPSLLDLSGDYSADVDLAESHYWLTLMRTALTPIRNGERRAPDMEEVFNYAMKAYSAQNWNAGTRLISRAMVVAQGRAPGEWLDVAYSLQFTPEARIVNAGSSFRASVSPLLLLPGALKNRYTLKVSLHDERGQLLKEAKPLTLESLEAHDFAFPSTGLADGTYLLRYELLDNAGKRLAAAERIQTLSSTLKARIRALKQSAEKAALSPAARQGARQQLAVWSLSYYSDLYISALNRYVAPFHRRLSPLAYTLGDIRAPFYSSDPIDPARDLDALERMAQALLSNQDPLPSRGELRLALQLSGPDQLLPFRLFLPESYTPGQKKPLWLAVHDAGGDSGSLFDYYGGSLQSAATRAGAAVLAIESRYPLPAATPAAFAFVPSLVALLDSAFPDPGRPNFLLGHGAGGVAAMTLAGKKDLPLTAVAVISGAPYTPIQVEDDKKLPVFVLGGKLDTVNTIDDIRRFGYQLGKAYPQFDYLEIEGAGHFSVMEQALPAVNGFFSAVAAGSWKPSGNPVPVPTYNRR